MGYFDQWLKAVQRARSDHDLSLDAIAGIDRFDREDLARIRDEMIDFRIAEDKLADLADTASHLASDTFHGFHKVDSKVKERGEMRPAYLINQMVATDLHKSPEFERLLPWTEGDIVSSAAAFVACAEDLEAFLDKAKTHQAEAEALEQKMRELLDAVDAQRDMDDMIREWADGDHDDLTDEQAQAIADAMQEVADQMGADAQGLADQLDADAAAFEAAANGLVKAAMPSLRKDISDAAEAAAGMASMVAAYGTEPGVMSKMSAAERIKLAERLGGNEKFKWWAELIGPMMRIAATEQTRKVYHSFEEVYDIGMGNELARLVPSELLALARPGTRLDFYRRYNEGKLLQYEMRGTEKVGKGGIICLMDNSGSMGGDKERWAKGVGGAAMSIAKDQKRSFYGIHFASARQIETFDFRKPEDMTLDRVLDYFEHFFGGGTNYEVPLTHGLKILQEEEATKGFVEGDMIFITDGECALEPAWLANFLAEKARLDFKVWGLLIGGTPKVLHEFCDHVITIKDLLSGENVRSMFGEL